MAFGNQPVTPFQSNSALTQQMGLTSQPYNKSQSGGLPQTGDFTNSGYGFGMDKGQENGFGGMLDNIGGLDGLSDLTGIFGGLYGLYNQNKGMNLAKDQLGMQKEAYYDNKNRLDTHRSNVASAFGH